MTVQDRKVTLLNFIRLVILKSSKLLHGRVIAATQLHVQLRHFNLNLKLTVNSVLSPHRFDRQHFDIVFLWSLIKTL